MKKFMICLMAVFIFTITLFNIRCEEVLVRIKAVEQTKITQSKKEENNSQIKKNVRIVIMDNEYSSIYHSSIQFASNSIKIYYGKKYKNQKACKKVNLSVDSKYFNESNVIKVEPKNTINWKNHSLENEVKTYKGTFYIYNTSKGLVAVNQVNMEDYVAAVISSEIGEDSPMEALKAQAVCARTFIAQADGSKYKKYSADADDSTGYQVYNRIEPGENSIKAAKDTKGKVMTYKEKLIRAYYFSTSCGYTTDYKIWSKKKKGYLAGCCILDNKDNQINSEKEFKQFIVDVPKAYEDEYPFYRWNVYLSLEQIKNAVYRTTNVSVGDIKKIEINSRGTGGIVSQITIYGTDKQIAITNQNQIRKALISYFANINLNDGSVRNKMEMLPSAFIYIEDVYKDGDLIGFKIYGGGFGHGSGMSQNGAIEMAKDGMSYEQILKYFYKDVVISSQ